MQELARERFDALMGSTRNQMTRTLGMELAWYSEPDERVLCAIVRDESDGDHTCIVLARDKIGRFRAVHLSEWFPTMAQAVAAVPQLLTEWATRDDQDYEQGDEPRDTMDFFTPRHSRERLNHGFVQLIESEEMSPAWGIIESLMFYFSDPDGNFVEQFQSTAFYARIWELYLFAVLAEDRCTIDRTYPAPDYLLKGMFGDAFIEAVTVNPSEAGEVGYPHGTAALANYLDSYVPVKFAGPLVRKLQRRYWEEPHIGDRPIILAIADYHCADSMRRSQRSLCSYLYGQSFDATAFDSRLLLRPEYEVKEHRWGSKRVPSGFFALPGAENISAVISTGEETMMKFNRMGLRAGFGSSRIEMRASGLRCSGGHPSGFAPEAFDTDVLSPDYEELWIDGLQIYHNPRAIRPLDIQMLGDATHHRFGNGKYDGIYIDASPFCIDTRLFVDTSKPQNAPVSSAARTPRLKHELLRNRRRPDRTG
ncbi:MAG: hypothetical protein ABI759_06275 [Candidatus Solibacter sp.]